MLTHIVITRKTTTTTTKEQQEHKHKKKNLSVKKTKMRICNMNNEKYMHTYINIYIYNQFVIVPKLITVK